MLTQVDRKYVAQVVEWLELFLKPKLLSGSFPNVTVVVVLFMTIQN